MGRWFNRRSDKGDQIFVGHLERAINNATPMRLILRDKVSEDFDGIPLELEDGVLTMICSDYGQRISATWIFRVADISSLQVAFCNLNDIRSAPEDDEDDGDDESLVLAN